MTREERAERRRKLAEAVEQGSTIEAVALAHDVSVEMVRRACREHGVEADDRRARFDRWIQIAFLLGRDHAPEHVAKQTGSSLQTVESVAQRITKGAA